MKEYLFLASRKSGLRNTHFRRSQTLLAQVRLRSIFVLVFILLLQTPALAQSPCTPAWQGQLLIDGETLSNWRVEQDNGSSGSLTGVNGFIGNAVQLDWNLGSGDWVQARYDFAQPIDLSQKDIFGISLRGSSSNITNRVSLMFADVNNVFFGVDCDGGHLIHVWMKNLPFPKKMFYYFFTSPPNPNLREIDWSRINRFFVVIKRPPNEIGPGGGSGQLAIDHLQADRAADWPRQQNFETVQPNLTAAQKAVQYILSQQKSTGLLVSWKEEQPQLSHLYDQALGLSVLTCEGEWSLAHNSPLEGGQGGVRGMMNFEGNIANENTPLTPLKGGIHERRAQNFSMLASDALQAAQRLVDFLIAKQKADGHWARTWRAETGEELNDDRWVGDQAWCVMALVRYAEKSGDANALASAQRGADWLASKILANGKVVPSTEGNVDVWWAMIATQRFVEADKIQSYLLTQVWDPDLKYWWRGRDHNENPDPVVAMDCATWVGEFAKSPRVNRPELAHAALSFVRRTLMTTDSSNAFCGFDGMGPVSVWCEGTAQYLVAGGEGAQQYLDMLLSLQRADGGMPGSTENLSGSCFGWLSKWTGLSSTAWLYFALTHSPFPGADCAPVAVHESATQLPPDFHLKQNHPNPFSLSTRLEYFIPRAMHVTLKVYDLNAREVMTLVDARQSAGWQRVAFNRAGLADGVYLIRLKAGDIAHTRKLVIVR